MIGERIVQVALLCVSVGQIVVAGLSMLSGSAGIGAASALYGARFKPEKQFAYIIRPLGVYMLAMSLTQLGAARDPRRYKRVVDATIVLFALRQAQRWILRERITSTFGIASERHTKSSLFFAFWGALLLVGRLLMSPEHPKSSR